MYTFKMKSFTIFFILLPVCLAGACRPTQTVTTTHTSYTDAPSTTAAPSPNRCGGFIMSPPTCPSTETCYHPTTVNPDLPGYCIGGPCGGFIVNPPVCPAGQVCVHNSPIADLPGKCVLASLTCAGDTGSSCPIGWTCVQDPQSGCVLGSDPNCPGVCYPPA